MEGGCIAYGGEERRTIGFGGKHEGKRLLGRPKHRWEDNINMIFSTWGLGCGLDRSGLG